MINTNHIIVAKLFFILIFISVLVFFASLRPHIMVVHSLAEKDTWVEGFNTGFKNHLSPKTHVAVSYQYLGSNVRSSETDKLKATVLTRQTIDHLNPDFLVLCGNNAQELMGRIYNINSPDRNIIFCNLNESLPSQNYGEVPHIRTIFQYNPTKAIKELVSFLLVRKNSQDTLKIILLGDNSDGSKVIRQTFANENWTPYSLVDLITVNTFEDWKEAISSVAAKADILLVSDYAKIFTDETQTVLQNPQDLIRWTLQNTTLPIIGFTPSFVKDGGDIAIVSSPFGQGEAAAKIVHRLLHNQDTKDILAIHKQDYLFYLNAKPKNSLVCHLPSIYPAFSQVIEAIEKKN